MLKIRMQMGARTHDSSMRFCHHGSVSSNKNISFI